MPGYVLKREIKSFSGIKNPQNQEDCKNKEQVAKREKKEKGTH